MTRRVLLLGANGQLGRSWRLEGGFADLVLATRDGRLDDGRTVEVADLSQPASLRPLLERIKPELIINAAAYTAVDRAEQEPKLAYRVNAEAIEVLASWAASRQALVLHYSTDYVFDGQATAPYPIDAPTAPINVYGHSKLAGEQALQASGAPYLLARTSWVYAPHGRNFLTTMLRLAAERDELRVVADQWGAPTSTHRIVDASRAMLQRWWSMPSDQAVAQLQGIQHLVPNGTTTWHGFASALIERAHQRGQLPRAPRVLAISSAEFPTPAKRPAWSVLDNTDLDRGFAYKMPDWREDLDHVVTYFST